jgi:hypothetical protein
MGSAWHIVAFPVILPWREEFWTLPLYFPDLKVGVIPGWPEQLPYQGMPLPSEAKVHPRELEHYRPGDLSQWRAFENYRRDQEGEGEDVIQAIRSYGQAAAPEPQPPSPEAWSLAWQLEKMQADQERELLRVDQGQDWLSEILAPEPWEKSTDFKPVPGVQEVVDPELGRIRYVLWRQVMGPYLEGDWAPFLLGRTSRAIFLHLRGWPERAKLDYAQVSLPGCRSEKEWQEITGGGAPPWTGEFSRRLDETLGAAARIQGLSEATRELQDFVDQTITRQWPREPIWHWDLEIWNSESAGEEGTGPVLCWPTAGQGVLPG